MTQTTCTAHRRPRAGWRPALLRLGLGAALAVSAVGCSGDEAGVDPPLDTLYYPLSLAAHPDGRYLYVANAVFDRTYNAGTLTVFDTWARRVLPEATVRIGLFAGEMAVGRPSADHCDGGDCPTIGYVVTRENNHLTFFETAVPGEAAFGDAADHIRCGQGGGRTCGRGAVIDSFGSDTSFSGSPFGVALDGDGLTLTHVARGVMSRWGWRPPQAGEDPAPSLPRSHTDFRCSATLPAGASSVARHPVLGWNYVTDRIGSRIYAVAERGRSERAEASLDLPGCELRIGATVVVDPDPNRGSTRGIAFSADGTLMYVAVSTDRALRIYDTSVDADGNPRNRLIGTITLGFQPNVVRVAGLREGEERAPDGLDRGSVGEVVDAKGGGLVYVSVFGDDRVSVIDPSTLAVVARIRVGQGPQDIVFMPDPDGRLRGFVSNFEDNSISILDLEPDSAARFTRLATVR